MNKEITEAFSELERGVQSALETYSNVHRGSGHYSMVSTHLYEQARNIVLEYLGLSKEVSRSCPGESLV
jgi:selenocysteine lyase/cysteine desulfurase